MDEGIKFDSLTSRKPTKLSSLFLHPYSITNSLLAENTIYSPDTYSNVINIGLPIKVGARGLTYILLMTKMTNDY